MANGYIDLPVEGGGGGTPGGSPGSIQYNNGGAFAGFGSWNGTTMVVPGNIQASGTVFLNGSAATHLTLPPAPLGTPSFGYKEVYTTNYALGVESKQIFLMLDQSGGHEAWFSIMGTNTLPANDASDASYDSASIFAVGTNGQVIINALTVINSIDLGGVFHVANNGFVTTPAIEFSGIVAIDLNAEKIYDGINALSIDWSNRVLDDNAVLPSINWQSRTLINTAGNVSVNYQNNQLINFNANLSVDWENRLLYHVNGNISTDWESNLLKDNAGANSIDWTNRSILTSGGITVLQYSSQLSSPGTTSAGYTQNFSANPVFAESTFQGAGGGTNYTISDIVQVLKAYGLFAP